MKQQTLSDLLRETHVAPAMMDRLARRVFNMGARFPSAFSNTVIANVPASGAETVVITTPPLTLPFDGAAVFIFWYSLQTIGTGTTAANPKIRRGTTVLGTAITSGAPVSVTAGNVVQFSGCASDANPGAGTPQYSLTLTGTGTTGGWGQNDTNLLAFAL